MKISVHVIPESVELPLIGSVHSGVVISSLVTLVICIFCIAMYFAVKYRFKEVPGRFQSVMESAVEAARSYSRSQTNSKVGDEMAPYIMAVAMFILLNCLAEYFAMDPPTGDLSLTLTLGIFTFFVINFMGIRHRKLSGRLRHYIQPTPIVAPFKLISDIATPVSLACRLYGNVLAGMIVMSLLYAVVPLGIPAALSLYFSLFHALIQSYVFITLTLAFVREAVE